MKTPLTVNVNGIEYSQEVEPDRSLLLFLRQDLGLTGTKEGCDDSECGACMVLVDGKPINSCSYLALQTNGRHVETVEGLSTDGELHTLQQAFLEEGGVQCGFCTPGMIMSAKALLENNPQPNDDDMRRALAGNLCRCTGYAGIFRAIRKAASAMPLSSR